MVPDSEEIWDESLKKEKIKLEGAARLFGTAAPRLTVELVVVL